MHLYIVARNDNARPETPPKFTISCVHPGCGMEAFGDTEGQAVRHLCRHIVLKHGFMPATNGGEQ